MSWIYAVVWPLHLPLWLTAIEDDYSGPKLDANGKVTVEFTEQLMAAYKEQQKLHRRYAYQACCFTFIVIDGVVMGL